MALHNITRLNKENHAMDKVDAVDDSDLDAMNGYRPVKTISRSQESLYRDTNNIDEIDKSSEELTAHEKEVIKTMLKITAVIMLIVAIIVLL